MSHIQKILERAERDGSIRPSTVPLADAPRATVPATADPVFPIPPVEVVPASAAAIAPPPAAPAVTEPRVSSGRISGYLLKALAPGTSTAEQYRALRARIQQTANGRGVHALAITSPARREGRTSTAAGLALTMAQEVGRRVCLVDANLRSPDLQRMFDLPPGPGLIDVLHERSRIEDALIQLPEYNLTILPAGEPTTQSELLGSTAMRRVIQALRSQFDRILIDAPAAIPVADIALLGPLVDGMMLVVRAGVTPKPSIHDALSGLQNDKWLGIVLNDAH